jgi:hypothetical protein
MAVIGPRNKGEVISGFFSVPILSRPGFDATPIRRQPRDNQVARKTGKLKKSVPSNQQNFIVFPSPGY